LAIRSDIGKCADTVLTTQGDKQHEELKRLVHALSSFKKSNVFGNIPDEEGERVAFALALVKQYKKSLQ
jgi:hypothetical protein